MKRLRIEHVTGFTYEGDVSASYNEARMLPTSNDSQFVLSSHLDIEPQTSANQYIDYFGTRVASFDVLAPHHDLKITARSLVEVRTRQVDPGDVTWHDLREVAGRSIATVEQLTQTARTEPPAAVSQLAARIASEHDGPRAAARAIAEAIGNAVQYVPGATEVSSTASQAWEAGKGVCQDITHITLGALRSVGIPARYVSGYLHPDPSAEVGTPVRGESHAWVEWYVGQWEGYDPTNRAEIDDHYVLVGRGRDYTDVPPLRGVYAGPYSSALFVDVTITRET